MRPLIDEMADAIRDVAWHGSYWQAQAAARVVAKRLNNVRTWADLLHVIAELDGIQ